MTETSRADEELIIKARKRFKTLWESETYLRESFERGMEFSFNIGEGHWSKEAKEERKGDGTKPARPYLTANLFSKFVAKVVNMERGLPDRDLVIPVDGDADPETADLYNKIIEDIEYHSDYDQITVEAGENAVEQDGDHGDMDANEGSRHKAQSVRVHTVDDSAHSVLP